MATDFSIIVTVKNRLEHFKKTFGSLVTQNQKQTYEIVYVDYASNDDFRARLLEFVDSHKGLFSETLRCIKRVALEFDAPFNSGKAKNLGSKFSESTMLSFSDVDVFVGMNYHHHWLQLLETDSFFSSRVQETTSQSSRRICPWVNYGNMIVAKDVFQAIGGFDENNQTWGGDDDDVIHRLKLFGLREVNPHNRYESHHISIVHDDELRLQHLESKDRSPALSKEKLLKIYETVDPLCKSYLNFYDKNKERIHVESVYQAP
jgi:predicted glycosyltransferase involved in capsule biosynthesis